MSEKIRGALWRYFFRSNPDAHALRVRDVQLWEGHGSAVVEIEKSFQCERFNIDWTVEGDRLMLGDLSLAI